MLGGEGLLQWAAAIMGSWSSEALFRPASENTTTTQMYEQIMIAPCGKSLLFSAWLITKLSPILGWSYPVSYHYHSVASSRFLWLATGPVCMFGFQLFLNMDILSFSFLSSCLLTEEDSPLIYCSLGPRARWFHTKESERQKARGFIL